MGPAPLRRHGRWHSTTTDTVARRRWRGRPAVMSCGPGTWEETSPQVRPIGAGGTIYVATNSGCSTPSMRPPGRPGGRSTAGSQSVARPTSRPRRSSSRRETCCGPGPPIRCSSFPRPAPCSGPRQFPTKPLSPTLSGNRVYVEQMGGTLSALDIGTTTPQLAWSLRVGTLSYGSPVVAPNGTIVTTAGPPCHRRVRRGIQRQDPVELRHDCPD